jgi:hypothetical protein
MRKLLIVSCLLIGLGGCASSGRIGELPVVATGVPTAKLVVIRVSSIVGVANTYYIALDGKDIFAIRSGEHTEFRIGAGEHHIGVKCFGGLTPTWKEDSVKFSAASETENFFEISPNLSCAEIKAIEADEAKKRIATSTFISPETPSSSK